MQIYLICDKIILLVHYGLSIFSLEIQFEIQIFSERFEKIDFIDIV